MDTRPEIITARRLLHEVLDGQIDPKAAIDQWPNIDSERDKNLQQAWHELYHYWADEDIRAKDPQYGHYQRDQLRRYLEVLEKL